MNQNNHCCSPSGKADLSKQIKGIRCDVQNCVYHANDHECCAGSINVGPRHADTSAETICSTFKCEC